MQDRTHTLSPVPPPPPSRPLDMCKEVSLCSSGEPRKQNPHDALAPVPIRRPRFLDRSTCARRSALCSSGEPRKQNPHTFTSASATAFLDRSTYAGRPPCVRAGSQGNRTHTLSPVPPPPRFSRPLDMCREVSLRSSGEPRKQSRRACTSAYPPPRSRPLDICREVSLRSSGEPRKQNPHTFTSASATAFSTARHVRGSLLAFKRGAKETEPTHFHQCLRHRVFLDHSICAGRSPCVQAGNQENRADALAPVVNGHCTFLDRTKGARLFVVVVSTSVARADVLIAHLQDVHVSRDFVSCDFFRAADCDTIRSLCNKSVVDVRKAA